MSDAAENDAPTQHYLYINMRDRGCNCGARFHGIPRTREALDAAFAEHLASVTRPASSTPKEGA